MLNAVLLPQFLTEAAILDRKTTAVILLKVFAKFTTIKGSEEEEDNLVKEEADEFIIEEEDIEDKGYDRAKENSEALATIAANCENILAFLQSIVV